jgi:hypothetical protein
LGRGRTIFVKNLKHWLTGGGTKSRALQKVQGDAGMGAVGSRGFEANHLAGGVQVGDVAVFQVGQGGGNDQREDLTQLKGSAWIYMEKSTSQADIPKDSLTLEGGVGIGLAGLEFYRERDCNPIEPSSFHR